VPGANAAAAALVLGGGVAGAVQVAVMGRFGDRIGTLEALAFSLAVSTLLAATVLLIARAGVGSVGEAFSVPKWMWIGGVMGAFVVFSLTLAAPKLGATATISLLVAGQLAAGVVIDRFGLFGVDRVSLSYARTVGIVLLVTGAFLTIRK
jgi:transporter family-2 protein